MTDDELTVQAELVIDRLMDAVAAYDRDAVGRALDGAPLLYVTVGLAYALYQQEVANETLTDRVTILDAANARLFRERRELHEKVIELRGLLSARASASGATAATRGRAA